MQLDKTHVAIRTRTISELGDLALVMMRRYPASLTVGFLIGALPWIIADYALLAWIPIQEARLGLGDEEATVGLYRFQIWFALLVFLQAPAAGVATTYYLGQAVFEEKPTWERVWKMVRSRFWSWFWVLGVVRMPVLVMILLAFRYGTAFDGFVDGFLPFLIGMIAWGVRGSRPFAAEILLLEQCPLRDKDKKALLYRKRSSRLHSPMSGELNSRFFVVSIILVTMAASLNFTIQIVLGGLTANRTLVGLWPFLLVLPISLWIIASISVLLRFLNYLDTRIRLEGWDVELAVRAERIRQFGLPDELLIEGTAANNIGSPGGNRTSTGTAIENQADASTRTAKEVVTAS